MLGLVSGLRGRVSRRLWCVLGRFLGLVELCGVSLAEEVEEVLARAVRARRGLEEAARRLYREGRLEDGLVLEALAGEVEEVERLLAEVEYLLSRVGLGEGFSEQAG